MAIYHTAVAAVSLILLALAACRDIATRVIPDWVCATLALLGLAAGALSGPAEMLTSIGFALAVFLLLFVFHMRGMLGGGDVKLFAATALQFPPAGIWKLILATSLAGGALAAIHLILRNFPPMGHSAADSVALRRVWRIERWRIARRGSLPYGVAIACGGAWTILSAWRP